MKILLAVTYYRPHVSGLTIYVERLGRALASRGHDVTVLASRHDAELPPNELRDGLRVVRSPVVAQLGKGPVMPRYPLDVARLLRRADVLSLHLPQLEAPLAAAVARTRGIPAVATYHCDLELPAGLVNRVVDEAAFATAWLTVRLANQVVAYTSDYAAHSRVLRRVAARTTVIPPPVELPEPNPDDVQAFRRRHGLDGRPTVAFAGRLAAEKGIEVILAALPELRRQLPGLVVLYAGPSDGVVGESAYRRKLEPALAAQGDGWRFLGTLDATAELPAFYAAADCLVLPSLNSTESFGLVQVEAMLSGTPVVVSDLPGVRHPVRTTGMGEIVPVGDAPALAESVGRVLRDRDRYLRPRSEVIAALGLDETIDAYERLFESVRRR